MVTKQKSEPAPQASTPVQPVQAPTSEDLATQCDRCSQLIDSLESQMSEIEIQHTEHSQAREKMKAEQEARRDVKIRVQTTGPRRADAV